MPDHRAAEEAYFRDTRIYPIMHALVVKQSVLERHPWVAMNLDKAFGTAKERSAERMRDVAASHAPLPWLAEYAGRMRGIFGDDVFPYGIGADAGGLINRTTLDAFCRFGHAQGICHRRVAVEELFPETVLGAFKV